jgi:hypothetical protein
MLQPGTALLLQCVQLSEGAADLVVESQSVRWGQTPTTEQHANSQPAKQPARQSVNKLVVCHYRMRGKRMQLRPVEYVSS